MRETRKKFIAMCVNFLEHGNKERVQKRDRPIISLHLETLVIQNSTSFEYVWR